MYLNTTHRQYHQQMIIMVNTYTCVIYIPAWISTNESLTNKHAAVTASETSCDWLDCALAFVTVCTRVGIKSTAWDMVSPTIHGQIH